MPYYLYKILPDESIDLVTQLDLLAVFDDFREAKTEARRLRRDQPLSRGRYQVMFAENQLSAEEQLLQKREKPILLEHER